MTISFGSLILDYPTHELHEIKCLTKINDFTVTVKVKNVFHLFPGV